MRAASLFLNGLTRQVELTPDIILLSQGLGLVKALREREIFGKEKRMTNEAKKWTMPDWMERYTLYMRGCPTKESVERAYNYGLEKNEINAITAQVNLLITRQHYGRLK